jgi:hypothetical protein
MHGRQEIFGVERGRPRRREEVVGVHHTAAARTLDLEAGTEGDGDGGVLGGGVGVGQRSTHRAPVADLEVADERRGPGEQGDVGGDAGVVLHCRLAGHGPDADVAVRPADADEVGRPVEVDDVLEAGQPQRQHGDEALATGEGFGVAAVLAQQADDLGRRLGGVVLERCRLHRRAPSELCSKFKDRD